LKKSKRGVWEGVVAGFEEQLRADGRSKNTIETYMCGVRQFLDEYKDANSVNTITQTVVNKWFSGFNPRKSTLNLKKIALNKFIIYLKEEYHFKNDIRISVKSLERPEPAFLTVGEQDRLLRYVKGFGEVSQYHVMLKLMLFTGLRVSEIIGLKFSDCEESTLVLRQTKHGNTRRKHLKTEIARMLKAYVIARRQKYPLNEAPAGSEDYLFQSRYGGQFKPFTRQAINKIIKRLAKQVGISKRISPHSLRHSFSVRFLSKGGSLLGLKNYLGHKHISTTEIYSHISDQQLHEELERL
jgi:integrase/recombinase XerD